MQDTLRGLKLKSTFKRSETDIVSCLQKSKACPFQIGTGLNPTSGNKTWKIPQNVPTATYFIRALVYAKNASDSANPNAVAIGDSKGFFEVNFGSAVKETGQWEWLLKVNSHDTCVMHIVACFNSI